MQDKPWGRIVNYRWPAHNERLMNEALAVYANKESADLSDAERSRQNVLDGLTAPQFEEVFQTVKSKVEKLDDLTSGFTELPASEKQKEYMFELLREYNAGMAKLKQFEPGEAVGEGYNYDDPDELIVALGMTPDQETMLTTVLTNELKEHIAKQRNIPVFQLELKLTHVKDVEVNYDYLTELIEMLLNQVHDGEQAQAQRTQSEIRQFANGLEDRAYAAKVINAVAAIMRGDYPTDATDLKYPYRLKDSMRVIEEANDVSLEKMLLDFRYQWGITEVVKSADMRELFAHHRYGQQDLDDTGRLRAIIADASESYRVMANDEEVRALSKIKYRNGLREAIYKLADALVEN
jgi:type I restriction enzyme R subunit